MPPGPITMPDLQSIDAVLNSKKHRWLYFVADPQRPDIMLLQQICANTIEIRKSMCVGLTLKKYTVRILL